MTEFNLSNKIDLEEDTLDVSEVREFIKRLKKMIVENGYVSRAEKDGFWNRIDTLAGEELAGDYSPQKAPFSSQRGINSLAVSEDKPDSKLAVKRESGLSNQGCKYCIYSLSGKFMGFCPKCKNLFEKDSKKPQTCAECGFSKDKHRKKDMRCQIYDMTYGETVLHPNGKKFKEEGE